MEMYVLSNESLQTSSEWQLAIDNLGFDLKLQSALAPPVRHGHLPAIWKGREAGFECGSDDPDELRELYDDVDFGGPWAKAYAFRWSSLTGCLGAGIAASAYAKATNGVVFDPQEGVVQSVDEAVRETRNSEFNFPRYEAMLKE